MLHRFLQQSIAILRIQHMGTNYEQLLQALPRETMPAYLCERICEAILHERERHERTRLVFSSLTGISSLAGLMLALPALIAASRASGFSSFASLFISDSDLIMAHFSTFGLSLLEALPGFEVTITLFLLAVFLVSLQNFVRGLTNGGLHGKHRGTGGMGDKTQKDLILPSSFHSPV
jgi:hypothetical protein